MPLLEEFFDPSVVEELADVALGSTEMERVLTELILEDAKITFEAFHLPLHSGDFLR